LLEAVVFGARAAEDIRSSVQPLAGEEARPVETGSRKIDAMARAAAISELRQTMSRFVGVERNEVGLRAALTVIQRLRETAGADRQLANAALTCHFVVEAALRRKESRGGHFRGDYPDANPKLARRSSMTLAGLALRSDVAARDVLTEIAHAGKKVR
jgi:L-aspartate oxidase